MILISSHFSHTSVLINICECDVYFILLLPSVLLICECILYVYLGWRDSSVGKLSASQSGTPGSNPGGGLTWVTQCMNERGRDYQL